MGLLTLSFIVNLTCVFVFIILDKVTIKVIVSPKKKFYCYAIAGLFLSLLALASCWVWVYFFNVFVALPALIGGTLATRKAAKVTDILYQHWLVVLNYIILITALTIALMFLILSLNR